MPKTFTAFTAFTVSACAALSFIHLPAAADSLKLESSVVVVNADKGEASLSILNEEKTPLLMVTRLEKIPEEKSLLLVVTPPVARIEPGNTQVVRFFLESKEELTTEHLERVSFEGVPPKNENTVRISIRQNIPVIIRPKGLKPNDEPWRLLKCSLSADELSIGNPSPYVVRMAQAARLLPSATGIAIPRTYILPGQTLRIKLDTPKATDRKLEISPASVFGYIADKYQLDIQDGASIPKE